MGRSWVKGAEAAGRRLLLVVAWYFAAPKIEVTTERKVGHQIPFRKKHAVIIKASVASVESPNATQEAACQRFASRMICLAEQPRREERTGKAKNSPKEDEPNMIDCR